MTRPIDPTRRRLALAAGGLPWLVACSAMPRVAPGASTRTGLRLYEAAAAAHGLAAFEALRDINVSYDGRWHDLVRRLQPVLTDAGYRQASQERLLPATGLVAQLHEGPAGSKRVVRERAAPPAPPADPRAPVRVWKDGQAVVDADELAAAALVADGYRVFLLGPLAFAGSAARFDAAEPVWIGGRQCDVLHVSQSPGLGLSAEDRFVLYVDRDTRLMRRVRFTLEGFAATRGAVAEVDTTGHVDRHGVRWPTRFFERLVAPIPNLPVHRWTLTGLDVDRGYPQAEAAGPLWGEAVKRPARPI